MTFLIDASTLIVLKNRDFPVEMNPDFWAWLESLCLRGTVLIPREVRNEILKGADALTDWIRRLDGTVFVPAQTGARHLSRVLATYSTPMTSQALGVLQSKADPYLIAHALAMGRAVITDEGSKPDTIRPERKKIPDICRQLGVHCVHITRLMWDHRATLPPIA